MADGKEETKPDSINVLLLGSAGSGKSFVGNILLSRFSGHKFSFKEKEGPRIKEPVREREAHGFENLFKVIETFDLMSSSLKEDQYEKEMGKWLQAADNSIDVVILVIRGDARYTKYNHDLYTTFHNYLMKMNISYRLNLVFTGQDILAKSKCDLKLEIEKDTINSDLKELIEKAERYEIVGKLEKETEMDDQTNELLKMITETITYKNSEKWVNKVKEESTKLRHSQPMVTVKGENQQNLSLLETEGTVNTVS